MMAAGLALGLALGTTGPASADPAGTGPARADVAKADPLPPGFKLGRGGAGLVLTWQASAPVPMGDAAVEFYAGGRLLGRPRPAPDQRTFSLDLPGGSLGSPADLADLQVRAAGRRLDAAAKPGGGPAGPRLRSVRPPAPAPAMAVPGSVDPGTPGGYRTVTGEYALRGVRLSTYEAPVEMRGVVVAPKGAPGRRPLALFLHGRHSTCFGGQDGQETSGEWPCPDGFAPIPSHRGYLRTQRLLASQGYVTVSISANGINAQDFADEDGGAQARSSLVRMHLARWGDWAGRDRANAPAAVRAAPPADLTRVLLIGHSRGGEGVNRAAMDSLSPPPGRDDFRGRVRWQIRGTVLIGPTIFGQNPAPDVPSVTILPGCDGDVADLQGQMYADATVGVSRGAALHSAVYVVGANHNFFNTEWTPGQAVAPAWDDFFSEEPDPVCTPGTAPNRLTPTRQQAAGATYVAAAARLFVAGDDRVRSLLDGSGARAPSAGPALVFSHAVGAARTPLLLPAPSVAVTGTGGRLCEQVHPDPARACLPVGPDEWYVRSPHFVSFGGMVNEAGRYAVALDWTAPGRPVGLRPARPVSAAGATALALRVVVPPNSAGTRFAVAVADAAGRRANLGEVRVDGLPGSANTSSYWAREVRLPLAAAERSGVDLGRIAELRLVPRGAPGKAWLVDAWGWRAGTPAPRPVALPRIDIGELTVAEGDSGTRTYRVPIRVSGRGHGAVRFFFFDLLTAESTARVYPVRPGTRTIDIPITVRGNTRWSDDTYHIVGAKAVRGTAVGDYQGGVIVTNDDEMPEVTVAPVADRVTEGASLVWRMTLSEPADGEIWEFLPTAPPAEGAELSTVDVDPNWFREMTFEDPLPERPLSQTYLALFAVVPAGELSADMPVPTVADAVEEPAEHVRFQGFSREPGGEDPVPVLDLTGTVLDG
jgi:hypothetical protein